MIRTGRAFVCTGLERIGGIMVTDVTNQHNPKFAQYILMGQNEGGDSRESSLYLFTDNMWGGEASS